MMHRKKNGSEDEENNYYSLGEEMATPSWTKIREAKNVCRVHFIAAMK